MGAEKCWRCGPCGVGKNKASLPQPCFTFHGKRPPFSSSIIRHTSTPNTEREGEVLYFRLIFLLLDFHQRSSLIFSKRKSQRKPFNDKPKWVEPESDAWKLPLRQPENCLFTPLFPHKQKGGGSFLSLSVGLYLPTRLLSTFCSPCSKRHKETVPRKSFSVVYAEVLAGFSVHFAAFHVIIRCVEIRTRFLDFKSSQNILDIRKFKQNLFGSKFFHSWKVSASFYRIYYYGNELGCCSD